MRNWKSIRASHSVVTDFTYDQDWYEEKIQVQWEDPGIYNSAAVRDLWSHRDLGVLPKGYEAQVPAHGVVMLRIDPQQSK